MIQPSPRARRHIARLEQHYDLLDRDPAAGLPAPRPYPQLAKAGRRWLHVRRYWIGYDMTPLRIIAVFYDTANIPKRL